MTIGALIGKETARTLISIPRQDEAARVFTTYGSGGAAWADAADRYPSDCQEDRVRAWLSHAHLASEPYGALLAE